MIRLLVKSLPTLLIVVGLVAAAQYVGIDLLGMGLDFLSSLFQPDWWPL
ncbi:hypothetical protein [Halorarius halobius]|nr:hypothetical protein [Halorarius halobius]